LPGVAAPKITHRLKGADRQTLYKFKLGYTDVFSMKQFYILMREWFIDNGFVVRDDEEFPETFYLQRDTPRGNEMWIRWRFTKEVPGTSGLWAYGVDVDFHVLGLKEIEFMSKGKKVKADKGEVETEIDCTLIKDITQAWEKHSWLQRYKDFMLHKMMKKQYEFHKREVVRIGMRLQDTIKSYLRIQTYLPEREISDFFEKRPE
jgi:hypothetical protein